MDKKKLEKLLPIQIQRNKTAQKKQESNILLSDMLLVNPIVNKTPSKNTKVDKIAPLSTDKIKNLQVTTKNTQKYVNHKQENHHRLSREAKFKENEKWSRLFAQKSAERLDPSASKKEINTSSKQLAQLKCVIDEKKKLAKKNLSSIKNYPKLKNTSTAERNLICSKAMYSDKVYDVDSMMKYFDEHMRTDSAELTVMKSNSSDLSKDQLNKSRFTVKKDSGMDMFNTKLRNKYFSGDLDRNKFDALLNKPNFQSIKKLLKTNKTEYTLEEVSEDIQNNLELDGEISDVSEGSSVESKSDSKDIKVLHENVDFLKKHRFYNYVATVDKEEEKSSTPESTKQELYADIDDIINKYRPSKDIRNQKHKIETNSIAVGTKDNDNNNLRDSIMKSNYLMKEFNMSPAKSSVNSQKATRYNNEISTKLTQDLEYLLK